MNRIVTISLSAFLLSLLTLSAVAQPPGGPGFGGPFGGPGMRQTRKILSEYDANQDGWLNKEERAAARAALKKQQAERGNAGGRPGGFGPPGMNRNQQPPKPGVHVEPGDVKSFPDASLYEPTVLRTLFFTFDNSDWETELEDFHGTDADVPATLSVDGKTYKNVGVHFRGMSSYMGVGRGYKRSLNVAIDLADSKQRLYGYKTLNLLNAHEDATFLGSVLYSHIARQYIPAPKANLVKVVVNGENWGVYVNVQQFNKEFLSENYKTTKGARWKVSGSPGGRGGLEYTGDDVEQYKRRYEIKSGDDAKSWKALINLCKVLNQTPTDKLEEALKPILDIDGVLWFLALDVALINGDGYWTRASDYSIYLDDKGKFHILPHDMNEAFRPAGGPGGMMMMRMNPGEVMPSFMSDMLRLTDSQKKQLATIQKETDDALAEILNTKQKNQWKAMRAGPGGGPGGGMAGGPPGKGFGPGGPGGPGGFGGMAAGRGLELEPLVALNDTTKPLRSKLLAVPALREKYLRNIRTIAEKSLDWKTLEPVVAQYRALIDAEVKADTRKLETYEEFLKFTASTVSTEQPQQRRGPSSGMNLRSFFEQRQKYLLNHADVKKLALR